MKINTWQIVALVMQALSEIDQVKAGEEIDLEPIHIKTGTTLITLNINVQQQKKAGTS